MTYEDLLAYVQSGLQNQEGYGQPGKPMPALQSGPPTQSKIDNVPGPNVILTFSGGAGLTTEDLFDQPFFQILSMGDQGDGDGAWAQATALDRVINRFDRPRMVGSTRVLRMRRVGSAPSLLMQDNALRYHYTCTYVVELPAGL